MMRAPIAIIADRRGLGKVWGWARFGKEVQDRRLPAALPTSHFLPKACQIPNLPSAAHMPYVLRAALAAQVPDVGWWRSQIHRTHAVPHTFLLVCGSKERAIFRAYAVELFCVTATRFCLRQQGTL